MVDLVIFDMFWYGVARRAKNYGKNIQLVSRIHKKPRIRPNVQF